MARRRWLLLAPAMTLLAACASLPQGGFTPPSAVAPPDRGVEPPPVRLLVPGEAPLSPEARPQRQLEAWAESMSDALNIPRTALQAYGYAQQVVAATRPDCGLSWPVLAGIGRAESSHGRHGGARLDETARPSRPIIGLPLDGSSGVKRIPDTDGGKFDGDRVWDRAVGPLQFIPSTWRRWATDGDGDGVADPQDIDDAALAAGNYLCSVGGDLREPQRYWSALLTYNESRSYGQEVLDNADHYGRTSRTLPVKG